MTQVLSQTPVRQPRWLKVAALSVLGLGLVGVGLLAFLLALSA